MTFWAFIRLIDWKKALRPSFGWWVATAFFFFLGITGPKGLRGCLTTMLIWFGFNLFLICLALPQAYMRANVGKPKKLKLKANDYIDRFVWRCNHRPEIAIDKCIVDHTVENKRLPVGTPQPIWCIHCGWLATVRDTASDAKIKPVCADCAKMKKSWLKVGKQRAKIVLTLRSTDVEDPKPVGW